MSDRRFGNLRKDAAAGWEKIRCNWPESNAEKIARATGASEAFDR